MKLSKIPIWQEFPSANKVATSKYLISALESVDWKNNVTAFCGDALTVEKFEAAGTRLAIWSKQFENTEGSENPAICFVREMQSAGHFAVTASAIACYKLAASGMRTVVETALYYSYFRSHRAELATLLRDDKWYIKKAEILEYHATHTANFSELQKKLPLAGVLNPWYSKISAIVHGQIPGVWHSQNGIGDIKPNPALLSAVVHEFEECVKIVDRIFFLTAGRELWPSFSPSAKKALLHGMHGDVKAALGLDST